jgi:hypothetical protein
MPDLHETYEEIAAKADTRPLFIPLSGKYYDQFISGEKRSELRRYGSRWNENVCQIGRRVVLSRGYGKQQRVTGVIREFYKRRGNTFGSTYQQAIRDCYGTLDLFIAEIRITLDEHSEAAHA